MMWCKARLSGDAEIEQNERLRSYLLQSRDCVLAEASPVDN